MKTMSVNTIEKNGSGIEKSGSGIEKDGSGISTSKNRFKKGLSALCLLALSTLPTYSLAGSSILASSEYGKIQISWHALDKFGYSHQIFGQSYSQGPVTQVELYELVLNGQHSTLEKIGKLLVPDACGEIEAELEINHPVFEDLFSLQQLTSNSYDLKDETQAISKAIERDGSNDIERDGSNDIERDGSNDIERDGSNDIERDGSNDIERDGSNDIERDGSNDIERDGSNDIERDGSNDIERDGSNDIERDGSNDSNFSNNNLIINMQCIQN